MLAPLIVGMLLAQVGPSVPVIPHPKSVVLHQGHLELGSNPALVVDPNWHPVGRLISQQMGEFFPLTPTPVQAAEGHQVVRFVRAALPHLGDEGYRLAIAADGVTVSAQNPQGAFYGWQTLRQLLRVDSKLPHKVIEDRPRFGWRGMMLDVSRHFFTVEQVKQHIDWLSEYKFNVFHWHLIDDGGWRLQIRRYPELTRRGAWRIDKGMWDNFTLEFPNDQTGHRLYGGYYTQDQVRDIVRFAAERFVTVVPEIEMPGHSLPAVISHPELQCNIPEIIPDVPYQRKIMCAGKETTYEFVQNVLLEAMELFPSQIIHIGADEVEQWYWEKCLDCQAKMRREGHANAGELQAYFVNRVGRFLNARGRTLMGWDEILQGGLDPNHMVMSWRGKTGGIQAAQDGHYVVMTPNDWLYFDHSYEITPTSEVYSYEPIPEQLTPEQARRVLGAQANVWTEWMPVFTVVEQQIFPRMIALSEVLWSPKEHRNWEGFRQRLFGHFPRLDDQGINYFVEPLRASANLIAFVDSAIVEFERPFGGDVSIHYTTDGTEPTIRSPRYIGPLVVSEDTRITATAFLRQAIPTSTVVVNAKRRAPEPLRVGAPGAVAELFLGEFTRVPEFDTLQRERAVVQRNLSIDEFASHPQFAVRWTGVFVAEADGLYEFTLGTDDGSTLRLDGALVVDSDFPKGFSRISANAKLLRGTYRIEVGFFELGEAERFEATVRTPDGRTVPLGDLVRLPG